MIPNKNNPLFLCFNNGDSFIERLNPTSDYYACIVGNSGFGKTAFSFHLSYELATLNKEVLYITKKYNSYSMFYFMFRDKFRDFLKQIEFRSTKPLKRIHMKYTLH